ncbi:oligosaccharide flippase family protein [Vibrio metschnikovii]|uniref:lipopolysaccharide biosynthesis protein n=1 Tax=Vibrio metschnikovii TaxID=28172 RepID=UPI00287B2774|nr:oligosaccharide flippase family protein [Vibrio metschnikovii]ELF5343575.1 oligosaccharide flippase family protein [Vibrio metschnikovii]
MSLTKNSLIYFFSNIINAAIPFLLLPILTRILSTEEYGQIAMFQILVTGLAAFVGLNTVGAANRKYYDDVKSLDELSQYNGACLHILFSSTIILLVIGTIFSQQLSEFLSIPISWIYSALFLSSLSFIMNLRLGQWQVRGDAFKFGTLQITNGLFNVSLSLLLVVVLQLGAEGRVDAQVIAGALSALVAMAMLFKDKLVTLFCWRPCYVKQALHFGVPLIPHVLGIFLLSAVDRFVINKELGLGVAGIYMVAVQLSVAFNIVFDAINKAYVPWLFEVLKRDNLVEKRKVVKYTYLYILLLLCIAPIPFLVGPWALVFIAGENYRSAGQVIGLLCFGQILGGMYLMVTNYIFYAKKTGYLAIVTISSGLINVALLLILVTHMGILGAALSFVLSKVFQFLLTCCLAYSSVSMPWFFRNRTNVS